jgi:hypothetical protein
MAHQKAISRPGRHSDDGWGIAATSALGIVAFIRGRRSCLPCSAAVLGASWVEGVQLWDGAWTISCWGKFSRTATAWCLESLLLASRGGSVGPYSQDDGEVSSRNEITHSLGVYLFGPASYANANFGGFFGPFRFRRISRGSARIDGQG